MTVLPKTSETVALAAAQADRQRHGLRASPTQQDDSSDQNRVDLNSNPVPVAKLQTEICSRTVGWIVGTSVAFEGVVLVAGRLDLLPT